MDIQGFDFLKINFYFVHFSSSIRLLKVQLFLLLNLMDFSRYLSTNYSQLKLFLMKK